MDMYGFYTGKEFSAHEYLGSFIEKEGVVFRTFAPNASKVSLMLDGVELPMQSVYDGNFYEITVPKVKTGSLYEYRIYFQYGGYQDHCDPYGVQMELRPKHKSIVCDLGQFTRNYTQTTKRGLLTTNKG